MQHPRFRPPPSRRSAGWARAACLLLLAAGACSAPSTSGRAAAAPAASSAAVAAFERVSALAGDWALADAGAAGPVTATYRVTGAGSAVIETLFPGAPEEMVSVYT